MSMTRRTVIVLLAAGCTPKPVPPATGGGTDPDPGGTDPDPGGTDPDPGDGGTDPDTGQPDTGQPDTGGTDPAPLEGPTAGNPEHLGETSSNHVGYLLGTTVQLSADGVVTALASHQDGAGHRVRMGLYTDDGGKPGALVVDSGVVDITATGSLVLPVTATALPAGTYWLLATYGSDSSLYAFPAYDSSVDKTVFFTEHPAADPLPQAVTGSTYRGQDFSYWLVLQD